MAKRRGKNVGISSVQVYETNIRKAEKTLKVYKNIRSKVMSETFCCRPAKMSHS